MRFLYLFVTFCAGIMSEAPKRNSTRERKPNRFLQLDDPEPPHHSTARQPELRDQRQLPEQTQLARILLRFVTNANKKLRQAPPREERNEESHQAMPTESHPLTHPVPKTADKRTNGIEGQAKGRTDPRRPTQDQTPRSNTKGVDRKQQSLVRAGNSASTEAETQKKMSTETQGSTAGGAKQGHRKKKGGEERIQREELRPFKRQSYHVAIAYHIYLKNKRPGDQGLPATVDPTYHARRLREMQERMQFQERKRAKLASSDCH